MKKVTLLLSALCLAMGIPSAAYAQSEFQMKSQTLTDPDNEPRPVFPVPSARQLKWNQTEFYAFFHYGMNTYTDSEWGNGGESESTFAPTAAPDPRQWLEAVKAGGMRGGIAVVKHHDGFCLWPTATTEHSVKNAGNEYGRNTNIPRDFAAAAQELGMKYGFYISPWDISSPYWGLQNDDGTYSDDYAMKVFFPQCAEIAAYGNDQFEMWFDGATGSSHAGYYGGTTTTTRTIDDATRYYDIPNLRDSIHNACPNIILWGVGGEARWIGNEAGWAGETCWSYGTGETGDEDGWYWEAGESDAKATSAGWFWHEGETVKSAAALFKIYLETVGRNATLILNFPPNKAGVLPDADVTNLKSLGRLLSARLGTDLARQEGVTIEASEERTAGVSRNYLAKNMIDGDSTTYWACNDGSNTASITITFPEVQTVHYVTLMEYIQLGQRIKGFNIETSEDGETWTTRGGSIETTTVGYKRIIPLNGSTSSYGSGYQAKYIRVNITDSKACPTLHTISVF